MKKKSILKVILITLMMVLLLGILQVCNADAGGDDPFDITKFENGDVPNTVTNLTNNTLGTAIGIAQIAGVGIAITILMVIAIKYMLASPGDRADIKKNAVPFVIGAVVLFGASGILGILADFASTI